MASTKFGKTWAFFRKIFVGSPVKRKHEKVWPNNRNFFNASPSRFQRQVQNCKYGLSEEMMRFPPGKWKPSLEAPEESGSTIREAVQVQAHTRLVQTYFMPQVFSTFALLSVSHGSYSLGVPRKICSLYNCAICNAIFALLCCKLLCILGLATFRQNLHH